MHFSNTNQLLILEYTKQHGFHMPGLVVEIERVRQGTLPCEDLGGGFYPIFDERFNYLNTSLFHRTWYSNLSVVPCVSIT